MQKMKGLVKYHLQQYFKTNKFVMPFAAFMIMLCSNYSVKPADFIDCLLVSFMFVFLIMVWVGVTVCDLENMVSEQILILRVQSKGKYYLSHILFLAIISVIIALIAIIFPVIQNLVNGNRFFNRSILISDVFGGFILLFLCAFLGSALGELSHPRIIKERKISVIFIFLLAILSLVKGAITGIVPLLKLIFWVLPPLWELSYMVSNEDYLFFNQVVAASGILILSSLFLTVIKMKLLAKRGF